MSCVFLIYNIASCILKLRQLLDKQWNSLVYSLMNNRKLKKSVQSEVAANYVHVMLTASSVSNVKNAANVNVPRIQYCCVNPATFNLTSQ